MASIPEIENNLNSLQNQMTEISSQRASDIDAINQLTSLVQELQNSVNEVKNTLKDINNPSEEYKQNLQAAINEVKDSILSINDDIESQKNDLTEFMEDIKNEVNTLSTPIKGFNSAAKGIIKSFKEEIETITEPTKEFKEKIQESLDYVSNKIQELESPINDHKCAVTEELNEIREEIYSLKNPDDSSKKVIASDVLDHIGRNNTLLTKFAKTVLDVSHPENFLFPPDKVSLSPSVTTITVSWSQSANAVSYIVHYNEEGKTGYNIKETKNLKQVLYGLNPNKKYNIYIIAKNGDSESNPSKIVSIKTLS